MCFSDLRSEDPGHPCSWEPAVCETVMVFDPVVEKPEYILSVTVSCQDGEPVGVSFCSER